MSKKSIDVSALLQLALAVIQAGVELFNRVSGEARQNAEMTAEEYAAWCERRDKVLAQPWHQVEPDPVPDTDVEETEQA